MFLNLELGLPLRHASSTGLPAWFPADATMGMNFQTNEYVLNGALVGIDDLLDITRTSSSASAQTTAGGVTKFGAGTFRRTDKGLLAEEARTNLILRSEEFDNASWTKMGSPVTTANSTTAPDGAGTADTLEDDSAASAYYTQNMAVADDSNDHTFSLFVKKDSNTSRFPEFQLRYTGGTAVNGYTQLNTNTGATTNRIGSPTVSVESVGDYWRIVMTLANNSSGNTFLTINVYPAVSNVFGSSVSAAVGSIIVWGAQVEKASFVTSYIPTTTSSETRNVDLVDFDDISWFNKDAGTWVVYIDMPIDPSNSNSYLFHMRKSIGTPSHTIDYRTSGVRFVYFVNNDVAADSTIFGTQTPTFPGEHKLAWGFEDSDFAAYLNGASDGSTATGGTTDSGYDGCRLGAAFSGLPLNGYIQRFVFIPSRRSNSELQELTQ